MANLINNISFDYEYPGQIAEELFIQPTVQAPDFLRVFSVISGINSKRQLTLPQALSKIVKAQDGCEIPEGQSASIIGRTLEVCPTTFRLQQCYDTFKDTWLEEWLGQGLDEFEIGQRIITVMSQLITDALARDWFRIFSFADTDAVSDDYNQCDGLFRRLIDGAAAYEVKKMPDITALNQTAGTRALDYIRVALDGAEIVLKQMPNAQKILLCTGNLYENLMQTYEDKAADGGGLLVRVENGVQTLSVRGIELQPIYAWDDALADADNPFFGVFNTALIYTQRDNHKVGVQRAADLGRFTQWYEKKDRKIYFDGAAKLGYQYVHGGLTTLTLGDI